MPIGILVFVSLLLIRDTLNENGMFANLHAKLKVLYRRWLKRRAKARLRREARERAEFERFVEITKRMPVFARVSFPSMGIRGDWISIREAEPYYGEPAKTDLQSLLKAAIENEDYETAAKIRDQIKSQ